MIVMNFGVALGVAGTIYLTYFRIAHFLFYLWMTFTSETAIEIYVHVLVCPYHSINDDVKWYADMRSVAPAILNEVRRYLGPMPRSSHLSRHLRAKRRDATTRLLQSSQPLHTRPLYTQHVRQAEDTRLAT